MKIDKHFCDKPFSRYKFHAWPNCDLNTQFYAGDGQPEKRDDI